MIGERSTSVSTVIMLLFAMVCATLGGAQGQISPTSVDLTVTPGELYVNMTENGSAVFSGHIQVTTLPVVATTIDINVTAGDWINETDQSNFVLTGNRQADFQINVYAPFDSLAGERVVVVVRASWTTSLNEQGTEEASVTAIVEQYFRVNLYSPKAYMSKNPGDTFDWESKIYVSNNGNGPDTLNLKVTGAEALTSQGTTFKLDRTSLSMDADGQDQVKLTISLPSGVETEKIYKFSINVTSEGDPGISDETDLQLRVKAKTTNGNGNGNGNTTNGKKEPETICSTELIPVIVIGPLCAVAYSVRSSRVRVRPPRKGSQ